MCGGVCVFACVFVCVFLFACVCAGGLVYGFFHHYIFTY